MERIFLALGSMSMFVAVAAGAFGAHALKGRLSPELLGIFEVGVRYQVWHALALIGVAVLAERRGGPLLAASGVLFVAGTILFSGSLYALSLTGVRALGAITPLGGLCFLAGWLALFASTLAVRAPGPSS